MASPKPPPAAKENNGSPLTIDDHLQHHHEEYQLRTMVAGGAAAAVTRVFVQPFDVLKIRFQLQVEPLSYSSSSSSSSSSTSTTIKSAMKKGGTNVPITTTTTKLLTNISSSKYTSMYQACKLILKEEGITAFWKGHTPAQGLSIVYGIVQFWAYEQLKGKAKHLNLYQPHKNTTNFVCGGLAGALGTIVTTPLDVIRTRLIAQDNKRGYPNTFKAGVTIIQKEGIRGVYRGLVPALLQVTPLTGINFMVYSKCSAISMDLLNVQSRSEIPAIISLGNGAAAGLISKVMVYPLDLAKKRLQIQGFAEHRKNYGAHFRCSGALSCFKQTIKQEGLLGLYKGMAPSIWKAGLTSALNFCIYDNIVDLTVK